MGVELAERVRVSGHEVVVGSREPIELLAVPLWASR